MTWPPPTATETTHRPPEWHHNADRDRDDWLDTGGVWLSVRDQSREMDGRAADEAWGRGL